MGEGVKSSWAPSFGVKDTSGSVGCETPVAIGKGLSGGAIKSDGGSSTYYDIALPDGLLDELIRRKQDEGQAYIKTEEIIHLGLGNDFDAGNIFKCLVRMESLKQGKGKAGNSLEYDANKVLYSAKKIAGRSAGK